VPAKLMQDFVSSLPSGVINLEQNENRLHIQADKYESTVNGIVADDFPVMPDIQKRMSWEVSASVIKTALQQILVAASGDEARPVLTGVYLHSFEGKLYAVATDSYRLAEKSLMKTKDDINLLVPASAAQDLLRVIGDYGDEVRIVHDDQQILFKAGEVELVTRLIEGAYPDYRKLIPAQFSTQATLKRGDLTNVAKVSSLFARESAGSITINVDEKDQSLSIRSIASQLGENTASASAETKGTGAITLNSRYLLDALNVMHGETVAFSFNGKLEPAVLKDTSDSDYLHVIMPLKS